MLWLVNSFVDINVCMLWVIVVLKNEVKVVHDNRLLFVAIHAILVKATVLAKKKQPSYKMLPEPCCTVAMVFFWGGL